MVRRRQNYVINLIILMRWVGWRCIYNCLVEFLHFIQTFCCAKFVYTRSTCILESVCFCVDENWCSVHCKDSWRSTMPSFSICLFFLLTNQLGSFSDIYPKPNEKQRQGADKTVNFCTSFFFISMCCLSIFPKIVWHKKQYFLFFFIAVNGI